MNTQELIEHLEDAAEKWARHVVEDTAPDTLPKTLGPHIAALQSALDAQATQIDHLQAGYLKIRVALGLDLHSTDNLLDVITRLRSCLSVRVVHQLQKDRDALLATATRLRAALEHHQEQTRPIELTTDALAAADQLIYFLPSTDLSALREKIHDEHRTGLDG